MTKETAIYDPPKMEVIELNSENTVLTTSGDYPGMPWG